MKTLIKSCTCNTLLHFIELTQNWCANNHFVIFRGSSNTNYPLIPGIARTAKTKMTAARIVEIQEIERQIFNEFLILANRDIKDERVRNEELLEVLCLAQHYGLPTRLLDWTSNPLAALWFALDVGNRKKTGADACIWAYCIHENDERLIEPRRNQNIREDPFCVKRTYIFKPQNITERISVQAGWFTLHHCHPRDGFVPLNTNRDYLEELAKIIIPEEVIEELALKLDILHLNSSVLFPGMEGSTRHLRWKVLRQYKNFG